MASPADAADRILKDRWVDSTGLLKIPVDPIAIARGMGIEVYTAQLDPGVSGVLVKHYGEEPEIYLDRHDAVTRQRFTCAHELGHFVHRQERGDDNFGYIDNRGTLSEQGTNTEEVFANGFAANLLIPTGPLRQHHHDSRADAAQLAELFRVSQRSMDIRLSVLGLSS